MHNGVQGLALRHAQLASSLTLLDNGDKEKVAL